MRYARAIEKLRTLADTCTTTAAIPGDYYFPLKEVYVFDELLTGPDSLDWVRIALVVDLPASGVTWGRQPDDADAVVNPLRLDKGGFSYFWRSHQQQVANHFIREPVRFWSREGGTDIEVLDALREKRFCDIPRSAFNSALLAYELAATLNHLRGVSAEYWDSKWRRANSGYGDTRRTPCGTRFSGTWICSTRTEEQEADSQLVSMVMLVIGPPRPMTSTRPQPRMVTRPKLRVGRDSPHSANSTGKQVRDEAA